MQRTFRIPREGDSQKTSAFQYVARAWPEGTKTQIQALFDSGDVKADGIIVTRPDNPLAPETVVSVEVSESGNEVYGVPDVDSLLRGDQWVVVDKPTGIPGRVRGDDPTDPVRFMADALGIDRDGVAPVWEVPAQSGGPWLIGETVEVADALFDALVAGDIKTNWVALTLRPDDTQGRWDTELGALRFATSRTEGRLAELHLTPEWNDGDMTRASLYTDILEVMAAAGYPALGDGANGGYLVGGDIRLRLQALYGHDDFGHSWSAPRDWWPDEDVLAPVQPEPALESDGGDRGSGMRRLKNLDILAHGLNRLEEGGHPWIRREALDERLDSFAPGDPVELVAPSGPSGWYAVIDGTGPIGARLWSVDESEARHFSDELEIRLDEAIGSRRQNFGDLGSTDVFRVVHGEADGIPGIVVDRIGSVWRVGTVGRCGRGYRGDIYELLQRRDIEAPIIEVEHVVDGGDGDQRTRVVHQGSGSAGRNEQIVRDAGLAYPVDIMEGPGRAFRPEQRHNRRRAVERAESGDQWLDIRGHTAGFSVALAKAGVTTTNVADGGPYFSVLDEALELNGLPSGRCEMIDGDAFAFLDEAGRDFDGIIVDLSILYGGDVVDSPVPRTSDRLLKLCFEGLSQDGALLCCRPRRRPELELETLLREAADDAGWKIGSVESAPPASDYPTLQEFPEGDVFEGLWVE